ncbi:hypothetical protein EG329_002893 [Mollisiaceae sp. DMI_Dod_QoI]|nr:hypothetical protein EG329_002893 [Helotiales sp. DMI_Dod_QoI]
MPDDYLMTGLIDWPSNSAPFSSIYDGSEWAVSVYSSMPRGTMKLQEAFASTLFENRPNFQDLDALDRLQKVASGLTCLLANMFEKESGELECKRELLLGPPTIDAARCFIEVAVSLSSNMSIPDHENDNFLQWLLENSFWPSLRPILLKTLPTIQAFMYRLFYFSIRKNDVSLVQDLLENDAGLRAAVQSSGSFLREAVIADNVELITLLLKCGADPNKQTRSPHWLRQFPLYVARSPEVIRLLVEANAEIDALSEHDSQPFQVSALLKAVARGDIEIARCLMSLGADVNVEASRRAFPAPVTALQCAIDNEQTELVAILLKAGADVHKSSVAGPESNHYRFQHSLLTPLQAAASAGNIEVIELLIEAGAGVNDPPCDSQVVTALQAAASAGNGELIKLLIEAVYDPPCDHQGRTALQAATENGDLMVVKFLISNGAKVNAPGNKSTKFPRTALLAATELNDIRLVAFLLNAGADVNAPAFGNLGSSILETAKAQENGADIVSLLLAHGAIETIPGNNPHRRIELYDAVQKGDLGRTKKLVDLGVTIDMREINFQETILHLFLDGKSYNLELFKFLVSQVADVNERSGKMVPSILGDVIKYGNIEMVQILLNAGADVNAMTPRGLPTALQVAVEARQRDTVALLLSKGADVNARGNFRDWTALQLSVPPGPYLPDRAWLWSGFGIFWLLFNHGADINAKPAKYCGRTILQQVVEAATADQNLQLKERYVSAIKLARKEEHFAIADLLKAHKKNERMEMGLSESDDSYSDLDDWLSGSNDDSSDSDD